MKEPSIEEILQGLYAQRDIKKNNNSRQFPFPVSGSILKDGGSVEWTVTPRNYEQFNKETTFKVKIQPNTKPGTKLRLRNAGHLNEDFILLIMEK